MPKYTTVIFSVKKELNITLNEYVMLALVERLQAKTGWAYANKAYYAENIDVTERSVTNLINKLVEKGLLETDSKERKHTKLRVTNRWLDCFLDGENLGKKVPQTGEKSSPAAGEKSSPVYNKRYDKENYICAPGGDDPDSLKEKELNKQVGEVIKQYSEIDPQNKKYYNNTSQREACKRLIENWKYDNVIFMLEFLKQHLHDIFDPPVTPSELDRKWVKVVAGVAYKNYKNKQSQQNKGRKMY